MASYSLEPELFHVRWEAREDAKLRGAPATTADLLHSLLTSREACRILEAAGASIGALLRATHEWLESGADDAISGDDLVARAAQRVLGSGGAQVSVGDVLVALSETPGCAAGQLLAANQVTPLALKLQVVQAARQASRQRGLRGLLDRFRRPPPARAFGPADRVVVIMHNDAFTSMEFVLEVLQRHFDVPEPRATDLAREVHQAGAACVAELPHGRAVAAIEEVTRLARARNFPLHLTVAAPLDLPRATLRR